MTELQAIKIRVRRFARSTVYLVCNQALKNFNLVRAICLAVKLSSAPAAIAAEISRQVSGFIEPTPADVIANYMRGLILTGSHGKLGPYEWKLYPNRSVITPDSAKLPRGLRRLQRKEAYEVRFNHDLDLVFQKSLESGKTWITPGIVRVYRELDKLGYVFTVECYAEGSMCGGLWGLSIGGVYAIMSMFHTRSNAGSIALAALVEATIARKGIRAIECGPIKPHFESFGAYSISSVELSELAIAELSGAVHRRGQ